MTRAEWRRKRNRLYRMLAAMHGGPLGVELEPHVRRLATELFEGPFPEVLPAPPAELHHWDYGFCPGSPELGCSAGVTSHCLPARLQKVANSALSQSRKRRGEEVEALRDGIVPCLETNAEHMSLAAYRSLMDFTRAVVLADASWLDEEIAGRSRYREGD